MLEEAIKLAQRGLAPRRRTRYPVVRARLLERLDLGGRIREVPAFRRLVTRIADAIAEIAA